MGPGFRQDDTEGAVRCFAHITHRIRSMPKNDLTLCVAAWAPHLALAAAPWLISRTFNRWT
jgi:hypothetical protein